MSSSDKSYLKFADNFENKYVTQKLDEDRTIEDTLEISYDLLSELPETEMKRLKKDFIQKYGKWK